MKSVLAAKWNMWVVFTHSPASIFFTCIPHFQRNCLKILFTSHSARKTCPLDSDKRFQCSCLAQEEMRQRLYAVLARSLCSLTLNSFMPTAVFHSPTHNRMCYIFSFHLPNPLWHLCVSDVYIMLAKILIKSLPSIISLRSDPVFWPTMYMIHASIQIEPRNTCSSIAFEQKI